MCLLCEYCWCKLSTIVSLGVAFDHLEHYFFPCGKKKHNQEKHLKLTTNTLPYDHRTRCVVPTTRCRCGQ